MGHDVVEELAAFATQAGAAHVARIAHVEVEEPDVRDAGGSRR